MFRSLALVLSVVVPAILPAEDKVDFNRDVRPILAKRCFACHGPDEDTREAGLRLDVRAEATMELDSGERAIVPKNVADSGIISRVATDDEDLLMPPVGEGERLSNEQIDILRRWIEQGAVWDQHWSYRRIERPVVPNVKNENWPVNDLDRFVLSGLEAVDLKPMPEASRYKLLRRVSLDLTGLPPTIEEINEFIADQRPDAYERAVDRLLDSSAYGERWARVWLDLARYADTNGYEKDSHRTVWAYRDWVIKALNRDVPFDQFTIEQIAGDLLASPTEDQLIATAFHRNTMTNTEGGTDDEEFRDAAVMDRINTTMQVWMGQTFGCCQCHSHKFDPLTQSEYYAMFAVFNQTEDNDQPDNRPTIDVYTDDQREQRVTLQSELESLQAKLVSLEKESENHKNTTTTINDLTKRLEGIKPAKLPVMRELPAEKQRKTFFHNGGSFLSPGEEVSPGVPAAFGALPDGEPKNRLAVARWLVSRDNPLTARVAVNRFWETFFGIGIVETSEDFGSQGLLPSNQALLDWLATEFMDQGWSMKKLCKLIVMSAAYRQSSKITPEALEKDPQNRLISRGPRFRLEAEMIRDQALAAAGLLSDKMYGPSVMPRQPDGIWQVVYSGDNWTTSTAEDQHRRGLYTFWRRTSPYPSMVTLDATSREVCTIRRVRTNTPLAALVTLNDPVYVEAAQALARRMMLDIESGIEDRVRYGFLRVLSRPPSQQEMTRLIALYETERDYYESNVLAAKQMATSLLGPADDDLDIHKLAAWTVVANVLLNLDETLTKD
ncbi:MAG: PSD1 domain-containing protein [Planctomycetales bacterium]|nr:PSD1 domain-containing protein [Planctomycetales bacterium]